MKTLSLMAAVALVWPSGQWMVISAGQTSTGVAPSVELARAAARVRCETSHGTSDLATFGLDLFGWPGRGEVPCG